MARVSGKDAIMLVDKVWKGKSLANAESHTAHLGTIVDENNQAIDQAVATVFRGPRSFTGEDVVEIAVHGSRWVQRELINLLVRTGCRIADAGEFTRRAFANGRMDLAEAEAVADVIASTSRAAHRIAMSQMRGDFRANSHISMTNCSTWHRCSNLNSISRKKKWNLPRAKNCLTLPAKYTQS